MQSQINGRNKDSFILKISLFGNGIKLLVLVFRKENYRRVPVIQPRCWNVGSVGSFPTMPVQCGILAILILRWFSFSNVFIGRQDRMSPYDLQSSIKAICKRVG